MTLIHPMFVCMVEIKKIQLSARDHFQRIFNDHEKLKLLVESQKSELETRGVELEKREARNESERKKLAEDIEKVLLIWASLLSQFLLDSQFTCYHY